MQKNKNSLISKYDKECLELAKEIIEANPAEGHSIESLTIKAGISRTKLSYGFKKIFSKSIHQFIISARMEEAKRMLNESDEPIKAIAILCGYRNAQNFLTAFKKYTGSTPTQYKKR